MSRFIGNVSAYAYAVSKGYTGTEEEFAELMASYAEVGQTAVDAAESALNSKTAAQTAATTATNKASEATTAAQTATTKAGETQTSAQTASTKASEAVGCVETATQKATESAQSASQALGYKNDAESAKTASQTAQGLAESARDTAVSAKNDAESARDEAQNIVDGINAKAEQIDTNTADIVELESTKADLSELYKAFPTDTASGAIASFSDGADDLPLKSLVVDINPVQDLHGYDSPWPAGGGKNLFNASADSGSSNGVTYTKNEDGTYTANGTANSTSSFVVGSIELVANTQYIISGCPSGGSGSSYNVRIRDANYNALGFDAGNGVIITPTETKTYYYQITVTSGYSVSNLVFKPMVCLSTVSNPDYAHFAPYSNICPISGWTEVGVQRMGKNLFDGSVVTTSTPANWGVTWDDTTATLTIEHKNTYSTGAPFCRLNIPTGTYTIKCASAIGTFEIRKNGAYLIQCDTTARQFTVEDGDVCAAYFYNANATTFVFKEIQLELSSTATPYEPYAGRSITIQLGQTVYGGHLDVVSGELVIDRAMVDLATVMWSSYDTTNKRWSTQIQAMKSTTSRSDRVWSDRWRTFKQATAGDEGVIFGYLNFAYFYTSDTNNTPIGQLMYELAEPIEIQLSANQINSLYGQNNIWADSGDTEVEYRADTKLFIERLTAPDSADMIADANITSGQYFMVGNSLYKATANIANGSAIIVGTNCIRKSLSEALNEINA